MDRYKAGLRRFSEIVSDLKFDIEPKYMAVAFFKFKYLIRSTVLPTILSVRITVSPRDLRSFSSRREPLWRLLRAI